MKKSYLHEHSCTATVVCCMDFRFWKTIINYVQNSLGIQDFDLITQAGGSKCVGDNDQDMIDRLYKHLAISENLHKAKVLVIANHEDCGAYGGSKNFSTKQKEFEYYKKHLKKARIDFHKKFPKT